MEDALVQVMNAMNNFTVTGVLILVVMEDALVPQNKNIFHKKTRSLNPCCNGRCTRTAKLGLCFV